MTTKKQLNRLEMTHQLTFNEHKKEYDESHLLKELEIKFSLEELELLIKQFELWIKQDDNSGNEYKSFNAEMYEILQEAKNKKEIE